jgi:hypothetical protein
VHVDSNFKCVHYLYLSKWFYSWPGNIPKESTSTDQAKVVAEARSICRLSILYLKCLRSEVFGFWILEYLDVSTEIHLFFIYVLYMT